MSLWKLWEPCALSQIWMHGGWEVVHWVGGGERGMQLHRAWQTWHLLKARLGKAKLGDSEQCWCGSILYHSEFYISTHMTATEQLSGRRCHVKLCWGRRPNTKGWKLNQWKWNQTLWNLVLRKNNKHKGESGWIQTLWNKSWRRRVNPWHWHHQSSRTLKDIWPKT